MGKKKRDPKLNPDLLLFQRYNSNKSKGCMYLRACKTKLFINLQTLANKPMHYKDLLEIIKNDISSGDKIHVFIDRSSFDLSYECISKIMEVIINAADASCNKVIIHIPYLYKRYDNLNDKFKDKFKEGSWTKKCKNKFKLVYNRRPIYFKFKKISGQREPGYYYIRIHYDYFYNLWYDAVQKKIIK